MRQRGGRNYADDKHPVFQCGSEFSGREYRASAAAHWRFCRRPQERTSLNIPLSDAMTVIAHVSLAFVLLLFTDTSLCFIDESHCPKSWISSGDACIKLFIRPLTSIESQHKCTSEGGILLDCDRPGIVDDVTEILKGLFDKGLLESTWLVSRRGGEAPRAIARVEGDKYKL
ncbi:unnamed protein product [Heligmosomoides polygyrus]|uniref:C-type lectin domain-containing protein n=1 Tax=Heligmosomoides polygyrus TaxID=6339 RepID=A0A183G516_HELPZ|nr:unnamed protein product [Heligmosomoides polygyrus]